MEYSPPNETGFFLLFVFCLETVSCCVALAGHLTAVLPSASALQGRELPQLARLKFFKGFSSYFVGVLFKEVRLLFIHVWLP